MTCVFLIMWTCTFDVRMWSHPCCYPHSRSNSIQFYIQACKECVFCLPDTYIYSARTPTSTRQKTNPCRHALVCTLYTQYTYPTETHTRAYILTYIHAQFISSYETWNQLTKRIEAQILKIRYKAQILKIRYKRRTAQETSRRCHRTLPNIKHTHTYIYIYIHTYIHTYSDIKQLMDFKKMSWNCTNQTHY
jgi:hypothetical protein